MNQTQKLIARCKYQADLKCSKRTSYVHQQAASFCQPVFTSTSCCCFSNCCRCSFTCEPRRRIEGQLSRGNMDVSFCSLSVNRARYLMEDLNKHSWFQAWRRMAMDGNRNNGKKSFQTDPINPYRRDGRQFIRKGEKSPPICMAKWGSG